MSETFEPFHVPQQSRRDKLRVISENHNHQPSLPSSTIQGCSGLTPLYGPTLLSSGMLTIAGGVAGVYQTTKNENRLKEDGVNFMDYSGSFVSPNPNPYVDPNPSVNINPNCCITDMDNSYMYNTQVAHNFRNFQSSFDSGVVMNGKGLSLSLSSSIPNPVELSMQNHYSGSSVYEQKGLNGYLVRGSSSINEASRSSVPLGPFTGYAAILKGSRFLKPAQQILEEFCDVGRGVYAEKSSSELSLVDPCINGFTEGNIVDGSVSSSDVADHKRKKTRLFSMLDEVYKRYKQYYQQMQAVVQSFETVAGLSNAAPFTCLALKAMSKHFWNLKKAITDQLRSTSNALGEENTIKSESSCFGLSDGQISHHRGSYNSSVLDQQHVWRPQRGLPERAVAVLRAWLFEHFLHPYPTDTDKQMLANQTGLSRSQVSNWFINARVRLWKPMVDEIHALELKQAQKSSETEEPNSHRQSENRQNVQSDQHSHSANTISNHSLSSKRHRDDINQPSNTGNELINFAYNGTTGVSLTLGLHQNNGICMSEPISINRFQSFGVEGNSNAYVGGFELRRNNFGSDMEGQLLHDFVG